MDNEKRKELDKFYTKRSTAKRLIDTAGQVLGVDMENAPTLEPSAGGGAFSTQLGNVVAYDLYPEIKNVKQQDFLSNFTIPNASERIAIGNPPFGKKGSLALQFLNKCGRLCRAVCFILPSTFKRWSVQSHVDPELHLVYEEDLPLDSFEFGGKPYSLNCVFQIWTKDMDETLEDLRIQEKPAISHPDLTLWQYNGQEPSKKFLYEDWDVATYRQGYKDYSKVFTREDDFDEVKDIVENTTVQLMFIRFNEERAVNIFFNKMDLQKLAKKNLSTPGFGKADFIAEYTKCLNS
jgi:hypothetical protein